MANNYLQFSTELTGLNKEHVAWFKKHLNENDKDDPSSPFKKAYEGDECFPCVQCEIEEDRVWFYAEESGSIEHVVEVVQTFFNVFKLHDRFFMLTWACTCSKPRVDEFDGGAVFVTSKNSKWQDSGTFLSRCKDQWLKRCAKKKELR